MGGDGCDHRRRLLRGGAAPYRGIGGGAAGGGASGRVSLLPDFSYDPPMGDPVILYQDARIIVVDKPSGLLSVPGKLEGRADCLMSRLEVFRPGALLVHRLDCDTSGVMIFARDKAAQGFLGQEFEKRRAKKSYIARVAGVIEADGGTIDLPLC